MDIRILTLPYEDNLEGFNDDIINKFCLNKKIFSIEPKFFENNGKTFWSVAITYETILLEDTIPLKHFDTAQKQLFDKLREWRKQKAEKLGFPVYIICKNTHLEQVVNQKITTIEGLSRLKGFGKAKIKDYGKDITQLVNNFFEKNEQIKTDEPKQ